VVALVGGLDYSPQGGSKTSEEEAAEEEEEASRSAQRRVLGGILILARRLSLPVLLSCRGGAEKDLAAALEASAMPPDTSRLLLADFHGGDADYVVLKLLRDWPGMSVGFDGRLTFAKAQQLRGLLFDVPLGRVLLQSSAPSHLPAASPLERLRQQSLPSSHLPEGFSHPAVLPTVAAKIAELKNVPLEEVMEQARANAKAMFGI
jgi:TatD DNase family protein